MRNAGWMAVVGCWLVACFPHEQVAQRSQCLDPVGGQDAAASGLRQRQREARARPSVSAWVGAGEAWLRAARAHSRPGLVGHAQDCAARALALDDAAPAAQRLQTLLLLDAHRFREARSLASSLVARDPDDVQSWGSLSDAELELGNMPAATRAAQQMLDRKPSLLSYGRAAHLRWLSGDRTGSKSLYRAAIRAGEGWPDPEPQAWMLVQAAWVFWHEGDYAGARAGFLLALRRVAAYAPALQGLGRAALSSGDYPAAIQYLERAKAQLALPETVWWLGDAYAASGRLGAARSAYAQVERLAGRADPRTLALFCATRGRGLRRGLLLAKRAFEARPDLYSTDVLAYALYRNGELDEAAGLAQQLVAAGVPDARMLFHAGLILRDAGERARGARLLARALALNPRFDLRLTEVIDATL